MVRLIVTIDRHFKAMGGGEGVCVTKHFMRSLKHTKVGKKNS